MWRIQIGNEDGKIIHSEPYQFAGEDKRFTLTTQTPRQESGVFKSTTRTTTGTSIVAEPINGESILITDIIVTARKKVGNNVTVQLTDGTNTETLINVPADNGVSLSVNFQGRWEGWKGARMEMVTDGNFTATAAIGYCKIKEGINFSEWDAQR